MNHEIELLAPAGNKENFIGAINAGANAVYLAGKQFGARAYASNFEKEEIAELINYAHIRNVKVFVTVNTIIYENEIDDVLSYTDFLVLHNVDALIVQDFGMIHLFTKRYPNTEIHASTQMNVYNVHQAKYLKSIGVSRIVLARETSIDKIKQIKQEVDIELEVFVHGALCVSYSGNCLFSAMNGGRSGNRGACAQPCRLPYTLLKENEQVSKEAYLMSTKDLLSINHIKEIIESGVSSLKIEGRMRSFEYVTETVKSYRNVINDYFLGIQNKPSIKGLKTVFNREYTKGYIKNEQPFDINNSYRPNHQGVEVGKVLDFNKGKTKIKLTDTLSKNDGIRIIGSKDIGGKVNKIIKDGQQITTAHKGDTIIIDMLGQIEKGSIVRKTMDTILNTTLEVYNTPTFNLIPLYMEVSAFVGNRLSLKVQTPFSEEIITYSDYVIPQANKKPQTKDQIKEQLSKLGNTPYNLAQFTIHSDEQGFIPNSVLKNLRRDSLSTLEKEIIDEEPRIINDEPLSTIEQVPYERELVVKVENIDQYNTAKQLGINTIYYKDSVDDNYLFMSRINDHIPKEKNLVVQDFGILNTKDKNIITNEHFNIVNSYSVESLLRNQVKVITLSQESSIKNTKQVIDNFVKRNHFIPPLEVIVYSTPDLMISKYCPITKSLGINKTDCGICEKNQYYLQNKDNEKFPLIRDYQCNIRVLHKRTMNHIDTLQVYKQMGMKRFRLEFTTESVHEVKKVINKYQKVFKR